MSSLAEAGDSMVCGKASIREALKKDTKDISAKTWADIQKTAETQVKEMGDLVDRTHQELLDLEAKIAAKRAESAPSTLTDEESKSLIEKAFGGDTFPNAGEAARLDCGYGDAVYESDDDDEIMKMEGWFDTATPAFKTVAEQDLKGKGRAVERAAFEGACKALLPGATCSDLCWEFATAAVEASAVGTGVTLGGPSEAELVAEAKKKRAELERAEKDHKECEESVATISGLHNQFVQASKVLVEQKTKCGKTSRRLKSFERRLAAKTRQWEAAKAEDKKAQDELREAIALQEEALANKEAAAENLRQWEAHMAALLKAIEEQTKVVRQTGEALRAADAASAAVSDFKDKLSTALNGLVNYYEEAVKKPLRNMGIREEVNIGERFPTPSETLAADNLRKGLVATKDFCGKNKEHFAKLPEIVVGGTKLTDICDAQNWDVVAGEVDGVVTEKRQRSITNLEKAQQKVKSYTGLVASKDDGEVEGVWKALAIYGDTEFSKNYLSGWRFSQDGAKKGATAGFMMELASALDEARKRAAQLWEEAKQQLAVLEEEKVQVQEILEVAKQYLKEMIAEYEKATENRIEKEAKAEKARQALLKVTAEKEALEKTVEEVKQDLKDCQALVDEANASLKATHETAMGSFMELLHASEKQQGDSWD